jgi:hypothetical protein
MAFKRVIIRRVGPLSWLLAAMIRLLFALMLFLYCCIATASFEGKCIVSGKISSTVEEGFFPADENQMKYIHFQLKLESVKGLKTENDKWCSRVFKDRRDSKKVIVVRINNPSADTVIPAIGESGIFVWSYFESENNSFESFSPYSPTSKQ